MRFVGGDDPAEAGAVRELDLQRKFYMRATELAERLGLTAPKLAALRYHLGIDDDEHCVHTFSFGRSKFTCYSDNALRRLQETLRDVNMDQIWYAYRTRN